MVGDTWYNSRHHSACLTQPTSTFFCRLSLYSSTPGYADKRALWCRAFGWKRMLRTGGLLQAWFTVAAERVLGMLPCATCKQVHLQYKPHDVCLQDKRFRDLGTVAGHRGRWSTLAQHRHGVLAGGRLQSTDQKVSDINTTMLAVRLVLRDGCYAPCILHVSRGFSTVKSLINSFMLMLV